MLQFITQANMANFPASKSIAIRNILLATDFGPVTRAALHYSLAIARRYGATVYLLHVVRPDMFQFGGAESSATLDDGWRDAQSHMTDLLIEGHLQGVQHKVLVEQGDVWEVLSAKIAELSVDLLVVGTHGRSRIGKLLLGSVAEEIFRQATCPVLMVGPKAPGPTGKGIERILFCTGFSQHSLHAGAYAVSMAEHQGAELIVLHVHTGETTSASAREQLRREGCRRLKETVPANAKLSQEPECLVEFGPAAERILAVAQERLPNLIVMGVRQPVGFARRLKWATAYEVVSNAPCPVLTVRTPITQ
jgi:nucleotide-binding universal stress UspA family protein